MRNDERQSTHKGRIKIGEQKNTRIDGEVGIENATLIVGGYFTITIIGVAYVQLSTQIVDCETLLGKPIRCY